MEDNFRIILIGGGSGSGKSVLTKQLARYYNMNYILVDDFRIAIQATNDLDADINFFFKENVFDNYSPAELSKQHKVVSSEVCKGLKNVIDHHVYIKESLILEGDDVLPEFADEMKEKYGECVSILFICETEYQNIIENSIKRGRHIDIENIDERPFKLAFEDNISISNAAREIGQVVLAPRPYSTLFERAIKFL